MTGVRHITDADYSALRNDAQKLDDAAAEMYVVADSLEEGMRSMEIADGHLARHVAYLRREADALGALADEYRQTREVKVA